MTKVLLSTVFGPFGVENRFNKRGDEELLDYLASRLTREPGLFALSSYVPSSSLHVIGANLDAETRVLEAPTEQEFIAELKKAPDWVGITFVIKGFGKVARMIALTRRYAPQAKVVVGGFGTALAAVQELGPDYVSTGEGVTYMRKLLGMRDDLPYVHPQVHADVTLKIFQQYDFAPRHPLGIITKGFGCPHACDFCSTSAYFDYKHVAFLKHGREIYEAMLAQHERSGGAITDFLLFEEDLPLFKKRLDELGALIAADEEHGFTYGGFGTVKALSRHDLGELVAGGFGHVWIGVESTTTPYQKREGRDVKDLFDELHSLGVTTTASMIFGLDHHTREQLPAEVAYLSSLYPSSAQISNLMPAVGTAARERLKEQGRIVSVDYRDADLFSEAVSHPNFEPGELTQAVFDGYDAFYENVGPAVFRMFDTWFTGYENLRGSTHTPLRRRAEIYRRRVRALLPLFLTTGKHLPNDEVRSRVKDRVGEVIAALGPLRPVEENKAELMARVFALEEAKREHLPPPIIEPELTVTDYPPLEVTEATREASPRDHLQTPDTPQELRSS